ASRRSRRMSARSSGDSVCATAPRQFGISSSRRCRPMVQAERRQQVGRRFGAVVLRVCFAAFVLAIARALQLARAEQPAVEVTSERSPISLRAQVRAVFETDRALDPETVARLSDTGKPHPLSPPNY